VRSPRQGNWPAAAILVVAPLGRGRARRWSGCSGRAELGAARCLGPAFGDYKAHRVISPW